MRPEPIVGYTAIVTDDADAPDRPYVRAVKVCPCCRGEKRTGSLTCRKCQKTRLFFELLPAIENAETALRWNAERKPDAPIPARSTDPTLNACPTCKVGHGAFWRTQHAGPPKGRIVVNGVSVGGVVHPVNHVFVQCSACPARTLFDPTKKQAAAMWNAGELMR